jgi:hypothetical protein
VLVPQLIQAERRLVVGLLSNINHVPYGVKRIAILPDGPSIYSINHIQYKPFPL